MDPSGSAPGHDGIPYEVLHHGGTVVACLKGQAFHAAHVSSAGIEQVLGPSIDIFVWVLKSKGGERPIDMRPLQLPMCIRRLFGAALASVVGPAVEPHMCDDQAAKAGGSCGPNIRRAYQHFEANMADPRGTGRLWNDMLGDCQGNLDAFIEQHLLESEEHTARNTTEGQLDKEAAVLLADQKQAFERLSIGWFKRVLDGWRFLHWVRRSFMALVESRSVTAAGQYGVLRRLLRSISMGGTASPRSWGIAYDPIVEGMFHATGVEAPRYVDDLAGLINGPGQAMRASNYLIWASWVAELQVTTHMCRRLTYAIDCHELRTACARLPIKTWLDDDGCRHVAGMPPAILRTLIAEIWQIGGHLAVETHTRCSCSLKTALVPNRKHSRWRTVVMGTPFRDSVVVSTWPYLGAALTSSVDDDADTHTHTGEQEAANRPHNDTGHEDDAVVAHPHNTLVNMGAVLVTQNRTEAPTPHHSTQWDANMSSARLPGLDSIRGSHGDQSRSRGSCQLFGGQGMPAVERVFRLVDTIPGPRGHA